MATMAVKVCPEKKRMVRKLTAEAVITALRDARGNLAAAAKALHVSRSAVEKWTDKNAEVRAVWAEERQVRIDRAEDKLGDAIEAGEAWAVCFALKCLAKDRGYVERQEFLTPKGEAIRFTFQIQRPDQETPK